MNIVEQVKQAIDREKGEALYFLGTTQTPFQGKVVLIHGVRLSNKNIRTAVDYLAVTNGETHRVQKFNKELDPVTFERFVNSMAMKIATVEPNNKLIEIPA